jgi:hypothetical protein
MSASQQALVGTLAVIVALYGIESLPNSMYDFLPIAYAGALHTLATGLVRRGTTPATTLAHNTQPASPVGGQRVRVG